MPRGRRTANGALLPLISLAGYLNLLRRSQLWFQILLAMALGIATGLLLNPERGLLSAHSAAVTASWLALPGSLFLTLIQMVVIGLVFSSIVIGLAANPDRQTVKRLGIRVVPFFAITTAIACVIGFLITDLIKPGTYMDMGMVNQLAETPEEAAVTADHTPAPFSLMTLPDRIVEIIPRNVIVAAAKQEMLQVVVFALFLGAALLALPPGRARILIDFFTAVQDVSLKIVTWAMMLAPYAVFGLMAKLTLEVGMEAIISMSVYVATVIAGLAVLFILYLLLLAGLGRTSPWRFMANARDVLVLAFSTSSSAAVMPLSMKVVEEKLGVRRSIAEFVIPLGATINMAGTALYQVAATVFLTQVYGVTLDPARLAVLIATVIGASIGTPASPGASIAILATLLTSVGVPASGIALIIGVDRILDMCRTSVNVAGDLVTAVLANRWLSEPDPGPDTGSTAS